MPNGIFKSFQDVRVKTKIIVPLVLLVIIPIALIVYNSYNLQNKLTVSLTKHDAVVTAKTALSSLNAMMLNGTIKKKTDRKGLFSIYKKIRGIKDFQVIRGGIVNAEFGKGLKEEEPSSSFDNKILSSDKTSTEIIYKNGKPFELMVGVPFVARTNSRGINCLMCHTRASSGDILGGVKLIYSLKPLKNAQNIFIKNSVIIAVIFIVIIILFLYFIIKSAIIKPITKMSKLADEISKGHFTEEIVHPRNDEIGSLAKSFNRMQISLKKAMELLRRGNK
ncbi:MAG: HAMP domain-containing protein [Candidatus Acidulodesulfobacterium ferriphilum]|jgi:HAMP domain-containing protein|uniref:histidine kinase n=1 Tax=Candidatus Acidulodesulfobacterium ferriphilum TaxID=2597223 RepID=A0A519BDS1_9DELT|nr:MAG: HAMP domain-containing protein [Candidatus Acidulodesulfobacterium ferriphilum]